jgi:hypothetical protein
LVDGVCVHPVIVHLIWPQVSHLIRRALERSDLGRFDILEQDVLAGRAILWLAIEGEILGAGVTQIETTEKSKVCVLRAVGGTQFKKWAGVLPMIEEYARMFGCDKVRFAGRKGWERLIKNYNATRVVMERRL